MPAHPCMCVCVCGVMCLTMCRCAKVCVCVWHQGECRVRRVTEKQKHGAAPAAAGPNVIHRDLWPYHHPFFSMGACRGPTSANTCIFTHTDTHMLCLAGHSHVWSSVQQAKEVKGHLGTYAEDVWVQIKCKPLWLKKWRHHWSAKKKKFL